jgi:putative exosortase-associated protein (TIGR04073 family)
MKRHLGIHATALGLLLLVGLLWVSPVSAEELYRESSEVHSMMTKLGRGATNVLTGWLELPKQVVQSINETDPVTGTIVGFVRGVGWTYARTVVGVYEIVTFPFPAPKNYEPLLEPEYIVKATWGKPFPGVTDAPPWATSEEPSR